MDLIFVARFNRTELALVNEGETLMAMGKAIEIRLRTRLIQRDGAHGPLPMPKDGGRPYVRSGSILESIKTYLSARGTVLAAVVAPTGPRPENENVAAKLTRARKKTRELRAVASVALAFAQFGGNTAGLDRFTRKVPTKSGQVFKLGSFRVRAADTNAALAGILSVPPKDQRSINGGRGVYRVFERNEEYERAAQEQARKTARFVMRVTRAQ